MNTRIKTLRKELNMSQEEFGSHIKITRSSVSKIETGENSPSDQTVKLICDEFGVNEVWLRTGEGGDENMFAAISEDDRYSISLGKLATADNKFIQNALITLAETDPDKLKMIEEFMKKCLGIE